MSEADHFVCPNGHRVDRIRTVACPEPGCRAGVVYEPAARSVALHRELEALREAVRAYLDGAPLDEHGRFKHARLEALYRASEPIPPSRTPESKKP